MIDVKLRLFIPSRAIALPVPGGSAYDEDNRGFSYDQGTSRAEIWIDVDNSPLTTHPINVKRLAFGQSGRYELDKVQDVGGKPFWWKDLKRDPFLNIEPQPSAVATADVTQETLNVRGTLEPGLFGLTPHIKVAFHVVGTLPLEPLAPPINCDLALLISAVPAPVFTYSLSGSHDGFPCYELYLNQRLVYSYDPVGAGTSPFDLILHGNIGVNIPNTVFV